MKNFTWIILLIGSFSGYCQSKHDFTKADSIGCLYPKYSLTNLELLSSLLTDSLDSDIDKYRSIFRWVCTNISSDYYLFQENIVRRNRLENRPQKLKSWSRKYRYRVFQRLIDNHETMCTGYAYLINELCRFAGIDCAIISGYGRTITSNLKNEKQLNHSWNAVKIEGKWWLSDATWSSGYIRSDNKEFVSLQSNAYFLVEPKYFWRNHYPEEQNWLLLDNKPSLEDFFHGPLVYRKCVQEKLEPISPNKFQLHTAQGKTISFNWKYDHEMDDVEVRIERNQKVNTYTNELFQSNGQIHFECNLAKKGLHVLHLYAKDEILLSYEILVQ